MHDFASGQGTHGGLVFCVSLSAGEGEGGLDLFGRKNGDISNFPGFPCYCLNGLNSSLWSSDSAIWADSNMGIPVSKKCRHFFVTHMSNPPSLSSAERLAQRTRPRESPDRRQSLGVCKGEKGKR